MMIYVDREKIKERTRIEYYFDCPGCGLEISDYDVAFKDAIECPPCGCEINFEAV